MIAAFATRKPRVQIPLGPPQTALLLRLLLTQKNIFKLEEEENTALLLHLPKLYAETADFGSAYGSGCRRVVATTQAVLD